MPLVCCLEEEEHVKRKISGRQRTSHSLNNELLIVSLFAMAAIGSTYYMLDARPEVFHANWLILSGLWYFSIAFSLFFTFNSWQDLELLLQVWLGG